MVRGGGAEGWGMRVAIRELCGKGVSEVGF